MENLEQKVIKIENEIKKLKASQSIGESNSKIYKIVDNGQIILNSGNSTAINKYIVFTTSGRLFPHAMIVIKSANYGSTACPTTLIAFNDTIYGEPTDRDIYYFSINAGGKNRSVSIVYDVFADTPGIVKFMDNY